MTLALVVFGAGLLSLGATAVAWSSGEEVAAVLAHMRALLDRLLSWRFNPRPGGVRPRHRFHIGGTTRAQTR